jgi:hypothetical protein
MRRPLVMPAMRAWSRALSGLLAFLLLGGAAACRGRAGDGRDRSGSGATGGASAALPVPPVAAAAAAGVPSATLGPGSDARDARDAAAVPDGEPYDQAKAYEAGGQLWLARLVLEKHALSASGAPRDAELLARLCAEQRDVECVRVCEAKLGRRILDAGVSRGGTKGSRARGD